MKTKTITLKSLKAALILILVLLGYQNMYAQNWYQINSGTQKKINTICFTSSTTGYIGGNDSLLMKTTDGGATWNTVNFNGINFLIGGEHIINMQFLNDNVGFITVGPYSGSYGTTDGGLTWTAFNLPGNLCYNQGMYFFNQSTGFIGGAGCFQGELISNVSGGNWQNGTWNLSNINSPTTIPSNIITDIDFYDAYLGMAVSKSGYVYRTTDSGANWDSVRTPAPMNELTSILLVNDTLAYAGYYSAGTGWGLYNTTDGGLSWNYDVNSSTFYYPDFYTLHQSGNGTIYTGGFGLNHGLIFHNPGTFLPWDNDIVDQKINDIASYNDSIVFAVGDSGYIVVNHPQGITGNTMVNKSDAELIIFPNPAGSTINISLAGLNQTNMARLSFYNALGQFVKSENLISSACDVSDLTPGIYLVEVVFKEQRMQKKLVIE